MKIPNFGIIWAECRTKSDQMNSYLTEVLGHPDFIRFVSDKAIWNYLRIERKIELTAILLGLHISL